MEKLNKINKMQIEKMKENLAKLILEGADYNKIYTASTTLDDVISSRYASSAYYQLKKIS